MVPIGFHLGLRQVVMALMNWAIDVPLELNKVMQYPPYPWHPVPCILLGSGGGEERTDIRWS